MSDILPQAPIENEPQLVDLIYELAQTRPRYLRPLEPGAAYYDLSGVERAVDPEPETEQDLLTASARRTWEPLGPVYLLEQTLQTLRWSNSPEPATYHVGRVPEAASYRFTGQEAEYTLEELVYQLRQGPAAFRGYPVTGGAALRLQFTPPLPEETLSESAEWAGDRKWLLAGPETVRAGSHYQLYEEVSEHGAAGDTFYIGRRTGEGEWLSSYSRSELAAQGEWTQLIAEVAPVGG